VYTDVQIINYGLGKIGAQQIERIDPPRTALERYVSQGYALWKRTELAKRRWVFAVETNWLLTREETLENVERPYRYGLPTDCMRPIRTKRSEWMQSGRSVYSSYDTLRIDYIRNVTEADFDVMFVEVLACRIALECAEYVTQSNTKKSDASALYNDAVREAGRCNAFTIGAENNSDDDSQYPFLTERY
jgi:hypothetical protein